MHKLLVVAAVSMAGCVAVPMDVALTACANLGIAQQEADMAPHWYIDTARVLEACGQPGALEDGEQRACAANKRNGYACKGGE